MDDRRGGVRGNCEHLNVVEHGARRVHVRGEDRWHVLRAVNALRGGDREECWDHGEENEQDSVDPLVIHDDARRCTMMHEAALKPPDE